VKLRIVSIEYEIQLSRQVLGRENSLLKVKIKFNTEIQNILILNFC